MVPYIITYDMIDPGQKYDDIKDIIANLSLAYIRIQKSVWLIKSYETPDSICDKLSTVIDDNDKLFVCELTDNYQGRQSSEEWDFIRENIF